MDPRLRHDHVSAVWSGYLKAPRPGRYNLKVICDDGARVFIDKRRVIDAWGFGHHVESGPVELTDRAHPIEVQYYNDYGNSYVSLHWEQVDGFREQIIPPEAFFTDPKLADKANPRQPAAGKAR
jgi:hypothetical protein